jgi:phytanoyl-CoA hydroxylase
MTNATLDRPSLDDLQAQFDRDGFTVGRGLFSADEIASIRDAFMDANKDGPVEGLSEIRRGKVDGSVGGYDSADPLSFYPRMMHPHRHPDRLVGRLAMRYMLDPRLKPVLQACIGEEPVAVQSMFYFKPPGARGQALHQDNFYLRVKPGTCCAAWIAIDDADEENGGMMCVPNTQAYPIQCPEKADASRFFTTEHVEPPPGLKPQLIRLSAGDVLFFNGNVVHGSYPNTSKTRFRRSLICHYVPLSTTEMSHFYRDPMRFDGTVVEYRMNNDGGPCGTLQDAVTAPH